MSIHNISFYGEMKKIIPELSSNTPPIMFSDNNGKIKFVVHLLSSAADASKLPVYLSFPRHNGWRQFFFFYFSP